MRVQFNFVFFDEKLIAIVLHANPRARAHFYRYTTTHSCRNTCEMDAREFYYSRIVCQTPLCSACRASRFDCYLNYYYYYCREPCVYIFIIYTISYIIYIYRQRQLDEGWNIIYYIRGVNGREDEDLSYQIMTLLRILIYIYIMHVCMRIILYPFNLFDLCTHVGQ
jgi:hypothetical protein